MSLSTSMAYLDRARGLIDKIASQELLIEEVAEWFAQTILSGRVVHLFGSGHSRIMVEEMWPRYGSFPGFHPIVELSLTNHHQVVGANGQRQAMFLENVPGLAERILRNFQTDPRDCALLVSSSGCNVVPIEIAQIFRERGIKVVSIVSQEHARSSQSRHPSGHKLQDFSDRVLDTGAPVGDAMVSVEGLATPVSPGSTIGGCLLVNAIKASVAEKLTRAGAPPKVLSASVIVGAEKAKELFESAYDEHAQRVSKLYGGESSMP